jgi:hypothetical protein
MRTRKEIDEDIQSTKDAIKYLTLEKSRIERSISKLKLRMDELLEECPNQLEIKWES